MEERYFMTVKIQRLLQSLMIIVSVLLLGLCAVSGTLAVSAGETNDDLLRSFMGLLTLLVCVGAVSFYISGREKPLDWMLGGTVIGTAICLCAFLGVINTDFAAAVFFWLYLLEFLLAVSYKTARHFGFFS